jgi:hypothetical protein
LPAGGLTLVLVIGLFVVATKVVPGHVGGGPVSRQDLSGVSLLRTEWQLTQVVGPSRTWSPPPGTEAILRFDGDGHFSATACNAFGGPVRIDTGGSASATPSTRPVAYVRCSRDSATAVTTGSAGGQATG